MRKMRKSFTRLARRYRRAMVRRQVSARRARLFRQGYWS